MGSIEPHPNIVTMIEWFEDKKYVFLVFELVRGGELFDGIVENHHYSEKDAARIARGIVQAVYFLHSKGIIHRDLKPENILFTDKK